jgi:hypothetical protein
MAVPLVQTHATSAYVDLPASAAVSVLVLTTIDLFASRARVTAATLVTSLCAAAVAVNTKTLTHPIVLVCLVAIALRALPQLRREGRKAWRALALVALAAPIVFWTPLANLVTHANPYYPIRVEIRGHVLEGPEAPYASSPTWLVDAPQPVRFAASLVEIGARPMSDTRRWTIDQWMPSDAPGYRMGGFFGAYVLVQLAVLGVRALRDPSRVCRVTTAGFAAFTALVAVLPQSHELRYYMSWMIVLVATNLRLAAVPIAAWPRLRSLGAIAVCALAVVMGVTRGAYAYPSGSTFTELLRETVDERALAGVADGERVCVDREPYDLLWAAPFHGARRYVVKEGESPADCASIRALP